MPANYTLHRFGADALRALPEKEQRATTRFRRLYNAGTHGADLFFYFRPMMQTPVGELYTTYHAMTGREFFTRACETLQRSPSEGGAACLYGLLANYCLNTRLSALFRAENLTGSRTALEVELDRYLLCLDGKIPAHTQDISGHFKLTRGECVTLSLFFPPATAANVLSAHRSMVFWTRRLAAKKRGFADLLLKATRGGFRLQRMPDHANHKYLHLDSPMAACYADALAAYPEMARQLAAFRETGTPLGADFDPPFHG